MKRCRLTFAITLGITVQLCLLVQVGRTERAYVADSFEITFRTGPSIENKIITYLRSNQPVEMLESQEEWTRVRILGRGQDLIEGWVLTRYLITRQPWEIQARALERENVLLKERLARTKMQWEEASSLGQEMAIRLEENTEAFDDLQNEYESLKRGAADYIKLKAKHESTKATLKMSQQAVQVLSKENENLRSSRISRWFATGALVLLCGLMIGLLVGRQQKNRRGYY